MVERAVGGIRLRAELFPWARSRRSASRFIRAFSYLPLGGAKSSTPKTESFSVNASASKEFAVLLQEPKDVWSRVQAQNVVETRPGVPF